MHPTKLKSKQRKGKPRKGRIEIFRTNVEQTIKNHTECGLHDQIPETAAQSIQLTCPPQSDATEVVRGAEVRPRSAQGTCCPTAR